jgi:hypothetical protein
MLRRFCYEHAEWMEGIKWAIFNPFGIKFVSPDERKKALPHVDQVLGQSH